MAKEIYQALIETMFDLGADSWFKLIWKERVQLKMIIFLWLVWRKRITLGKTCKKGSGRDWVTISYAVKKVRITNTYFTCVLTLRKS